MRPYSSSLKVQALREDIYLVDGRSLLLFVVKIAPLFLRWFCVMLLFYDEFFGCVGILGLYLPEFGRNL